MNLSSKSYTELYLLQSGVVVHDCTSHSALHLGRLGSMQPLCSSAPVLLTTLHK